MLCSKAVFRPSLRDLKEMMAERGLNVDHSTVHR
ncbi:MAG: IS6 family transposase, partial [Mesorhizobium sp.]